MIALCVLGIGTMGEGSSRRLEVDKDRVFYGQLPYGIYSIGMENLEKVIIKGLTKQER